MPRAWPEIPMRPESSAWRIGRDEKGAHAAQLLRLSRARKDDVHARPADIGDEDLGAVEDIAVDVSPRARLKRSRVGSGGRLGERERAKELAGREPGKPLSLLRRGAEQHDRLAADAGVDVDDDRRRRAGLRQLLDADGKGKGVKARAAVLARDEDSK